MPLAYYDIDESDKKYNLEKMDVFSEDTVQLWSKHYQGYLTYCDYWKPRFDTAKKCQRYVRRDIFTPGQRKKYYHIEDKWPIEPQVLKPVINDLVTIVDRSVPGFSIGMEDTDPPPTAAQPEIVKICLKSLENTLDLSDRRKDALREGMITGVPIFISFDRGPGVAGLPGKPESTLHPWDACLPTPGVLNADGDSIKDVYLLSRFTKSEMYRMFPERKKDHIIFMEENRENPDQYFDLLREHGGKFDSETINEMFSSMILSSAFDEEEGYVYMLQHLFPISNEREVYINEKTYDVQIIPSEWDEFEKQAWIDNHPEYDVKNTDEVYTLWSTIIDSSGFIWENEEHWFQEEGELPGEFYIAAVYDKITTGAAEDLLPDALLIAASETEGLSEVRKGTGTVTHYKQGSLAHPAQFRKEMNKPNGAVEWKNKTNLKTDLVTQQRKPNETFYLVSDRAHEQMKRTARLNDAYLGTSGPRTSDKARKTDISQAAAGQAMYVRNYTRFNLRLAQKLCKLLPYFMDEEDIVEIDEEYGEKQGPVAVNQKGYDLYTGQAKVIANDLTLVSYKIVPIIGDDSPISQEIQLEQWQRLMEAMGNSIANIMQTAPGFLGTFFKSLPNKYARQMGEAMEQQAQVMQQQQAQAQQAEIQKDAQKSADRRAVEEQKLRIPKTSFKFDPKDIQEAPMGMKAAVELLENINQNVSQQQQQQSQSEQVAAQQAGG